jgi:hypothetical protein
MGRAPRVRLVRLASALLSAAALVLPQLAFAHGVSEGHKAQMIEGGGWAFLKLGAIHMVTGYDHLLFLFGVLFFLASFKHIVKFVTAFTIGHSLTLFFATYWGISANYYLVDAVIALSVVYKGFDNLDGFRKHLGMEPPHLVAVVFGFGLIHGFGLSTRLQELALGEEGLLRRIVGFNIGVELGQITVLCLIVPALILWRKRESFSRLSSVANRALITAGVLLFLMQMHGYEHTTNPDDLGWSEDLHRHAHEDMAEAAHGHSH